MSSPATVRAGEPRDGLWPWLPADQGLRGCVPSAQIFLDRQFMSRVTAGVRTRECHGSRIARRHLV